MRFKILRTSSLSYKSHWEWVPSINNRFVHKEKNTGNKKKFTLKYSENISTNIVDCGEMSNIK